jgi:DNA helicase-2/ATP-dependent DNA helicase PcrA
VWRVNLQEFEELIVEVLGERRRPNTRQRACIDAGTETPTLIVAGPGTGKTSVLVLRALRHLLVDRIAPQDILITTFTIKAAKEIRTRILEWGEPLVARALELAEDDAEYARFLEDADVNRIVTGTLDSVCQEALGEQRAPGERRYVVMEGFAANAILSRIGNVAGERNDVPELNDYLSEYSMFAWGIGNNGEATRMVRTIIDRFVQDAVDVDQYVNAPGPYPAARAAIGRIYERYRDYMLQDHRMDFALLESIFLDRIREGRVPDTLRPLRALLVDEYQDTNPLQEQIYFELTGATGAALTVVGDDDQSLYRFRGATIELFRAFRERALAATGLDCGGPLYLVENYRSSPEIVGFYNDFIATDPQFAPARIQPPKPAINATQPSENMPVLGIFRQDAGELALAVADFFEQIFRGGGRAADAELAEPILAAPGHGDLGDAVLLGPTVNEFTKNGRERFPSLLRAELENRDMGCFNPRGRALRDQLEVRQLLGLVLLSLEPGPTGLSVDGHAGPMWLTREASRAMLDFRQAGQDLIDTDPEPVRGRTLRQVLARWQDFSRNGGGAASEWPLLDVFYAYIPWLPGFRDDPEGQVYLEAISRCAAQAATFSAYRGLLLRENDHRTASIRVAIRDAIAPIAEDLLEVEEDIMPSVPRNLLNIMTIHQAKGLEFPLVMVDVASDYKTNHHTQAFQRYPRAPSAPAKMEDDLAFATPIGPLRQQRSAMERSFEDIIRRSYVAYSRPQNLLVLVGCIQGLRYGPRDIPNISLCWRQDGSWAWRTPCDPPPPLANHIPLTLI